MERLRAATHAPRSAAARSTTSDPDETNLGRHVRDLFGDSRYAAFDDSILTGGTGLYAQPALARIEELTATYRYRSLGYPCTDEHAA